MKRPLATICVIINLLIWLYVHCPLYEASGPVYLPDERNVFSDTGIREGDTITLSGQVTSINEHSVSYQRVLYTYLKHIKTSDGQIITGPFTQILAIFPINTQIHIGQDIVFTGELSYFDTARNPGEFDSYNYYHNNGVIFQVYDARVEKEGSSYSKLRHTLYEIRLKGEDILVNKLGIEDASIMKAMVFGNKNEIPTEVKLLFQKNGIAHILAISGLHISFLAMGLFKLLELAGLGKKKNVVISELAIVLYGILVGFPISAVRAVMMFSIYLISRLILRTYDILTAVSVTMTLVLLVSPSKIMDSGFLLSFAAVYGVSFFYNAFTRNVAKVPKILASLMVSMFVFLTTLPILLWSYYEIAPYSILLNIVIIPLMSLLLVATIGLIITGAIEVYLNIELGIIAKLLTKTVTTILAYYKGTCRLLIGSGFGRINIGQPGRIAILVFYVLLIISVWGGVKRRKRKTYIKCIEFAIYVSVALTVLFLRNTNGLGIWMLDVGQGDCMVLQNEKGHVYICDCGSSSRKSIGERVLVPMLKCYGVNDIEAVFITHPDSDHMSGISELIDAQLEECLNVKAIYIYDGFKDDDAFRELGHLAKSNGTRVFGIHSGMRIEDGALNFNVIYPGEGETIADSNNASLVMNVSYGDFHMLTTGDVEAEGEDKLCERDKLPAGVNILKVAHHGSASSTTREFLNRIKPGVALISAPVHSVYGHPSKEVLSRLESLGVQTYCTKDYGAIHAWTDGKRVKIDGYLER